LLIINEHKHNNGSCVCCTATLSKDFYVFCFYKVKNFGALDLKFPVLTNFVNAQSFSIFKQRKRKCHSAVMVHTERSTVAAVNSRKISAREKKLRKYKQKGTLTNLAPKCWCFVLFLFFDL